MKIVTKKFSQRIINATLAFCLVLSSVSASVPFIVPQVAHAAPHISYTSTPLNSVSWATDRTAPSGGYVAGTNTLTLNVDNTNASSTSGFYRTEGVQTTFGSSQRAIESELFVDPSWSGKPVRVGMWGITHSSTTPGTAWPIIEYTTIGSDSFSGWRVFDTMNGGWTNLTGVAATTGAWNKLELVFNSITNKYDYYVNDNLVYSLTAADGSDVYGNIDGVIFNNFNSATGNNSDNYSAQWRNFALGLQQPNTAPTVNFTSPTPAENSYVRGTVNPHVVASDDYGMGSYYIRLWKNAFESELSNLVKNDCYSAPGAYLLGSSQNVTCSPIDTTKLSDGKYVLSAQFLDGDNVWGSQLRTFYVDNTRPLVTVSNENSYNPSSLTITATDTNGSGVDRVTGNIYKYDNVSGTYNLFKSNSSTSLNPLTVNLSTLADGQYYVRYNAADKAGNISATSAFNFTVDHTAPGVPHDLSWTGLNGHVASGNFTNSKTGTLSWQDVTPSDVQGYVYEFWTDIPGYFNGHDNAWTTNKPVYFTGSSIWTNFEHEGTFFFCVAAVDAAGNKSACSDTYNVTYDNTAPGVPVHLTPFNNAIQNVNDFYFQWNDVADAVSYEAQFSQSDSTDSSTGSLNSSVWAGDASHHQPTASEAHSVGANGTWYWQVRSVDAAGNKSAWSTPWKLTIDMVAPAVPTHVSPEDGVVTTTADQTSIDWTDVSDPSGVTYIYQSSTSSDKNSDGSFVTPAYTSTALTASEIPTPGTPEGVYYWHVKAVDGAGNESAWTTPWMIIVDNTAPVLSLNTVDTNTETSRTITGTTDPFAEVTVTVHSTPPTKVTTADADGKWSVTFDGLEIGSHIVTVSSKDKAGNVAEVPTQNFEVTTVPAAPQSNSSGPTNQGQPLVAFNNATPSGDNQSPVGATENDGQVLAAQDVKQNVASTAGTIKNTDGTWGIFGIAWYWILAMLAAIAVAWWLVAAYRRRQNEA